MLLLPALSAYAALATVPLTLAPATLFAVVANVARLAVFAAFFYAALATSPDTLLPLTLNAVPAKFA
jgi:hypothetical protein